MSFSAFLFASIIGTALTFRKELSAQSTLVVYDPFPELATAKQKQLYDKMEESYKAADYAASIEAAETLMQTFPHSPWLYMRRAMCFGQTGRYDDGIADFTKALELDGACDGSKTYLLGGHRHLLLNDIELLKNMRVAHERALAEVASKAAPEVSAAKRSKAKDTRAPDAKPKTKSTKAPAAKTSTRGRKAAPGKNAARGTKPKQDG
jgi:hypothetical protein